MEMMIMQSKVEDFFIGTDGIIYHPNTTKLKSRAIKTNGSKRKTNNSGIDEMKKDRIIGKQVVIMRNWSFDSMK